MGYVEPDSVIGGTDMDGERLYICASNWGSNTVIGKVKPSHKTCYLPYGGKEHKVDRDYALLVGWGLEWMPFTGRVVFTERTKPVYYGMAPGEVVYACRAVFGGRYTPGKFVRSHDTCYVPFGGKEHGIRTFDLLYLTGRR